MAYDDQDGNLVVRAEAATEWRERAQRLQRELDAEKFTREQSDGAAIEYYEEAEHLRHAIGDALKFLAPGDDLPPQSDVAAAILRATLAETDPEGTT